MLGFSYFKMAKAQDVYKRFLSKVNITDSCWEWTACKDRDGYGSFQYKMEKRRAPRVSYILFKGPIPDGLQILHSCDNPGCVNPAHLSADTSLENTRDMIRKGRKPSGMNHWKCKLTDAQVLEIRKDTRTQKIIAEEYGIGTSQVNRIRRLLSRV